MSWLENPILQNIDKRKLDLITQFAKEAEAKPLTQSLPLLMAVNKKLKSMNLSFTPEENSLIIDAITQDLSPEERLKVDAIKKLMSN